MGRRNRREKTPEPGEIRLGGFRRSESHTDGEWIVQSLTGSSSEKEYRCPGCDQEIPVGTPHIVAWRSDDVDGRRHWHKPCWNNRANRRIGGR